VREQVLADFFAGKATAAELAADLAGAEERIAEHINGADRRHGWGVPGIA